MPGQKVESSRPGSFVGVAAIAFFRAIHKRMAGIGVGMKFMLLLELLELGVELRHVFWRRIAIVGAKVALERTVNFRAPFERRRNVPSPRAKSVARIISDRCFECRNGGSHEINHPPAHAKSDNPDLSGVDRAVVL